MLKEVLNLTDAEAKSFIDGMTDAQRLEFIKEANTLKEEKQAEKAKLEAELKLTNESLESEIASMKTNFNINSVEELQTAVEQKTKEINEQITNLVKAMKGEN